MHSFYVGLGTNLGDRKYHLHEAIKHLEQNKEVEIKRLSSIYETDPVGFMAQPSFFNMVIRGNTSLSPISLLRFLLQIENKMGRTRLFLNAPRTMDLDLLIYGNKTFYTNELQLPHPRISERAFVLIPLKEVWTRATFPWEKQYLAFAGEMKGIIRCIKEFEERC